MYICSLKSLKKSFLDVKYTVGSQAAPIFLIKYLVSLKYIYFCSNFSLPDFIWKYSYAIEEKCVPKLSPIYRHGQRNFLFGIWNVSVITYDYGSTKSTIRIDAIFCQWRKSRHRISWSDFRKKWLRFQCFKNK